MSIIVIGIDLAKSIFAVHGVNEDGKAELVKPKVNREQLLPLIAQLPPCLIGMEACSGAHHWARLFRQHGHTVKLIAPKFVTPYRMSGKRGKNDAVALRSSQSALGAYFRRMCARMDKPKAVTAAAHKLARLIYTMLTKGEEYTDQGQDYYEERFFFKCAYLINHRRLVCIGRKCAALGGENGALKLDNFSLNIRDRFKLHQALCDVSSSLEAGNRALNERHVHDVSSDMANVEVRGAERPSRPQCYALTQPL